MAQKEMKQLGLPPESQIFRFFTEYTIVPVLGAPLEGQLNDPSYPTPQLAEATEFVRDIWEVSDKYLCLTEGEGEGFILYELESGKIFDLGVEDLDRLQKGQVECRWESFFEYIRWYLHVVASDRGVRAR